MLIRHADAGDRGSWAGDDALRPLTPKGKEQALRLAASWRDQPLTQVLSSPFVRCAETVEPLASGFGLEVGLTDALAEGHAGEAVELVQSLVAENAALCTHGDIVPAVLHHLDRAGADIVGEWTWTKGSTWVLHTDNVQFSRATYVPRPL